MIGISELPLVACTSGWPLGAWGLGEGSPSGRLPWRRRPGIVSRLKSGPATAAATASRTCRHGTAAARIQGAVNHAFNTLGLQLT